MPSSSWTARAYKSNTLVVPDTVTLLRLPPYASERNPVENIWPYLRRNTCAHRLCDTDEDIVQACCDAWNGLIVAPTTVASITTRD